MRVQVAQVFAGSYSSKPTNSHTGGAIHAQRTRRGAFFTMTTILALCSLYKQGPMQSRSRVSATDTRRPADMKTSATALSLGRLPWTRKSHDVREGLLLGSNKLLFSFADACFPCSRPPQPNTRSKLHKPNSIRPLDSRPLCYSTAMQYSLLTALIALAPAVLALPATPVADASLPGSTANVAGLDAVAKQAGKLYLGTATDNNELTNTQYTAILNAPQMFGQITAENSMKWDATEPQQGVFTFTQGDQIANLATSQGKLLRGHNCVWHQQLPNWVTAGNFNAQQLTAIVQNHCSTVVSHYKGRVLSWDVVNEPLNDDGSFRQDVFFNTLGSGYIATALRAAKAADPNAKVYINDFNIEGTGAKATAMKNLVKTLKSQGVPIDGIGLQSHFIVGEVPTTLVQNMQEFTALGVEVAITELDIRMTLPETAALLQQQKNDFQTVISACRQVQGCVGVTLWDFTDKFSFVPSTFPGQGAATPWDQNLVKKPAFDGVVAGFQ